MIQQNTKIDDKILTVVEIFYSLQGEGVRAGTPNIFIRLSGCNLSCWFCDTDFSKGTKISLSQIKLEIEKYNCKSIIWTGGEPTLQLDDSVVNFFKSLGYYQAIETNGCYDVPNGIDFITCSPKKDKDSWKKAQLNHSLVGRVDEYKFPIIAGEKIDINDFPAGKSYLISPIFDDKKMNMDNLAYCIEYVKSNFMFRLSIQQHKIWGVR